MRKQFFFERECVHREAGTDGEIYNGIFFIQALQRLQSDEALKMASKVSRFFGSMRPEFWCGFVEIARPN